jgi:amino acid transporter
MSFGARPSLSEVEPVTGPSSSSLTKSVSVFHLVAITFYYVCAGPFGQEEAIFAGGALYTFLATLLTPIVFSLPVALASSELSTRFPACGGSIEWALSLGKPLAIVNAWVRCLGSVCDNCLYPILVLDYLCVIIPGLDTWYWRLIVTFLCDAFVVACNVVGLEAVGWSGAVLSIVILVPFVLFVVFAAKFMTPDAVFARYPEDAEAGPDFALLIATSIWQFCGFDSVGALSGEVKNPRRHFPIAMFITVALVTLVYLLPTIAGVSAQPDVTVWEAGYFATVSETLPHCGNGWLSHWISIAGAASSLSLLNAALSCNGRELYASGVLGAFPFSKFLGTLDKNMKGDLCPIRAIVVMAVLTLPFALADFTWLVEWSGFLLVEAQLLQTAIFVACRFRCAKAIEHSEEKAESDPQRKFVVGWGWFGVLLVTVPPTLLSFALLIATSIWQFCGFDSVGALSGEVKNPRWHFPIAMFITVTLDRVRCRRVDDEDLLVLPDPMNARSPAGRRRVSSRRSR